MHLNGLMVPLGGFVVAIVAIVASVLGGAHKLKLKAEQRMAMVARGMTAEEINKLLGTAAGDGRDPLQSAASTRKTAIVLISTGVGLLLFFLTLTVVLNEHDVLSGAAIGLIPIAIGVGFLIDYKLQKRDLARFGLEFGRGE